MSRRHAAEKREILPDAKFGDLVITKFINSLMNQGKRSVAERIVYGAFDSMERKANGDGACRPHTGQYYTSVECSA